jgi:hypothetical protein
MLNYFVCTFFCALLVSQTVIAEKVIESISFVDPDTYEPIPEYHQLKDGATVDLTQLGEIVMIEANCVDTNDFGSIHSEMVGATVMTRIEPEPPWTVFGTVAPARRKEFAPGMYTFTLRPYTEDDAMGEPLPPYTVKFRLIRTRPNRRAKLAAEREASSDSVQGLQSMAATTPLPDNSGATVFAEDPESVSNAEIEKANGLGNVVFQLVVSVGIFCVLGVVWWLNRK